MPPTRIRDRERGGERRKRKNGRKKCEIFKAKCHIKMTYLLVSSGGLGTQMEAV